jgi:hypothetical protein
VRPFARIPLIGATAILAAILVAGIYAGSRLGSFWPVLVAAVAVVIVGVLFFRDYRERPLAAPRPRPVAPVEGSPPPDPSAPPEPEEIDDAEDPVIEADRIASGEVLPSTVEGSEEAERSPDQDGSG